MSKLNFGISGNNADLQQKTKQISEAINSLESDLTTLHAEAGNCIKGVELFISELQTQIDSTIMSVPADVFISVGRELFESGDSNTQKRRIGISAPTGGSFYSSKGETGFNHL